MHPAAVVQAAAAAGVHGVVVCDHNAADNVPAVLRAAASAGIGAVPGMEITTEEEVHVVALLPDAAAAGVLHARVAAALPLRAGPHVFGEQVIANEHAEVLGFNPSQLAGATAWSLERTVDEIHRAGGLAVAAHVDRERFGLFGQLGFVPQGLPLDAVEISARMPYDLGRVRFGQPLRVPVVTGSDAHAPSDVGRAVTLLHLERPDAREIMLALRGGDGRAVMGGGRPMEDLAMHILDVAQNAIEAGATRVAIDVTEDTREDRLTIRLTDDGRGMSADTLARATDPFFTTRTTRRVGLGLPLLAQAARASGGALTIDSAPGRGTAVHVWFQLSHVDRAPLGDLQGTLLAVMAGCPDVDIRFRHAVGDREYAVSSELIADATGGQPVQSPAGLSLLRRLIEEGEAAVGGPSATGVH
jgi:hypothetical protein